MNELNHWHPVLLSKDLKKKPISIKLCGQEIVLFRTEKENIGALEDICPHRRMRLSEGSVNQERLVCPYHGWNYEADGTGCSASTPDLKLRAKNYAVTDRYGLIWIKAADSKAELPNLDFPDYQQVCLLEHRVHAPLELLVDINSEIEHAALVHTFFGHAISQVSQVDVQCDFSDSEVTRIKETMPQKPLPKLLERLFSVQGRDRFVDEIEFRFSPVYKMSQLYWKNSPTGEYRKERVRSVYFFTPISERETKWISLYYIASPRWGKLLFHLVQKPILKTIMNHEGNREKQLLEKIADKQLELESMCLGRLDSAIKENRQRLKRIYRQQPQLVASPREG
jgi:vanillate O-demethylase monooxygenase subunit